MALRVLNWAVRLGIVGGFGAAINYKCTYESIPKSTARTREAVTTFSKDSRRELYDVAVVGGGIVGVATVREIRKQFPTKRVILLEKEADVAQHQSSHNSGVIHAGMYYAQHSLMARLCPRGHDLMTEYCKKNNLPYKRVGKIIVAVKEAEIPALEKLYKQGVDNGVRDLKMLHSEEEIKKLEPNVHGVSALYSPNTAITDFAAVTRHMLKELQQGAKGLFDAQFKFEALDFVGLSLETAEKKPPEEMVLIRGREEGQLGPEKTIVAKNVIACCGLSNDLLAKRSGPILGQIGKKVVQTFSFRGRYYQLKPEARDLVSMNVYPAPDALRGIGVGVHFTPTVDEQRGHQLIMGPGSAAATHRYGYSPYFFDLEYCWNSAMSRGGWVNFVKHFGTLFQTFSVDVSRTVFLHEARKLVPSLKDSDVEEGFAGVMGMAVAEGGELEMDLSVELSRPRTVIAAVLKPNKVIELLEHENAGGVVAKSGLNPLVMNVRNAPTPAATSSMSIAEDIVAAAKENFNW
ncbi:2-hydroxyglutarate dehydrogenase [Trypanosoma conorhini]|uniref:L-2-hydroxyglutarate dehydrogenase, mitochondrial n=1 Tax=Trypanosoma conorhini TaxID=83891 RepID=A0A422QA76_9TRYP|nr:2-hydroxyglutarate dehydrogenase [Trypanosoma conorhini]RNF26876.1 2-hydroxyglutarate dehydrogenase [Trypanosoma conorhini]